MKTVKALTLIESLGRPFIAESPFPLCLDLNVFRLSLPAQDPLFDQFGYFVHEDYHDHQNDDADDDVGYFKNSCLHANENAKACGERNNLTDDAADDGEVYVG